MTQAPPPAQQYHNPPPPSGGKSTMTVIAIILGVLFLIALIIGAIIFAMLIPAVGQVRGAARRVTAMNNARIVVLATHNFDSLNQKLPENVTNADGEVLHSWRTNLLPYLEQNNLAEIIQRESAWDSSANSQFTSTTIDLFESPRGTSNGGGLTHFVAVVGNGTAMGTPGTSLDDIQQKDGLSVTGLVLEYPESDIQWGEPRDVTIAEAIDIIQTCSDPGGVAVGMADGAATVIAPSTSAEDITRLFNMNDGPPAIKF